MNLSINKQFCKAPFALALAYAFMPSLRLLGINFSTGDLLLLFYLLPIFINPFGLKYKSSSSPLAKHVFIFLIFSLLTFLVSSILIGNVNYINSLLIIARPFMFLVFLHNYFSQGRTLNKQDFKFFVNISTIFILLFSAIVVTNIGYQFTQDDIWNYSPTTRLVGLRGVIFGAQDGEFAGNDSVNFSLFVCLISLLHFSFASIASSHYEKLNRFLLGVLTFILSSLCLSKSSYVFIVIFFIVFSTRQTFYIINKFRLKRSTALLISTLPCIFILPFSSELVFNYIFLGLII